MTAALQHALFMFAQKRQAWTDWVLLLRLQLGVYGVDVCWRKSLG